MPEQKSPGSPRAEAVRLLEAWLHAGPAEARLPPGARRPAVTELAHGAVRRWRTLAWLRSRLAAHAPRPAVEACLLVALQALFFMDDEPDHAVVHEAVDLARARAGAPAAGFVNAVLRRAIRERDALRRALAAAPVAVRGSLPDALAARWTDRFGAEGLAALADWCQRRPELSLRLRAERVAMETFLTACRARGREARPHPARPADCALAGGGRVEDLPGYAEGWFVVQDPSTLLAPDLLAPRPGETLLDACAAPGGKTAALADAVGPAGRILALDLRTPRVEMLRANLVRLGLSERVCVAVADARDAQALGAALRAAGLAAPSGVLLDVPCTNTGVLARRPEARWHFSPAALAAAAHLQRALLDGAAAALAPGGRLVYSTCSLEPEENGELVRAWLRARPGWQLVAERAAVPPAAGVDGAYAALIRAPAGAPATTGAPPGR